MGKAFVAGDKVTIRLVACWESVWPIPDDVVVGSATVTGDKVMTMLAACEDSVWTTLINLVVGSATVTGSTVESGLCDEAVEAGCAAVAKGVWELCDVVAATAPGKVALAAFVAAVRTIGGSGRPCMSALHLENLLSASLQNKTHPTCR